MIDGGWLLAVLAVPAAVLAAGHALLHKRDPRSAVGWIALSLVVPLAGPALYFLLGVNRVNTRARRLERRWQLLPTLPDPRHLPPAAGAVDPGFPIPDEYAVLARITDAVTRRPLVPGNSVEPLEGGGIAFPAILAEIEGARSSVWMSTYLFDVDAVGERFVDALAGAAARGVDVRVLVDGVGEWYSRPRASRALARRGVQVARFLPPRLFPPQVHINLRNHRKILVVDERVAFTGGMNVRAGHASEDPRDRRAVRDVQFRLHGPVVHQIAQTFWEDWCFATGEGLPALVPSHREVGPSICRTILDGPNDDLDKLAAVLVGAISAARRRIDIVTPYFLPPREMISALQAAALRGVAVSIVLPERSNLPYVDWATRNMLWEVLGRGARVHLQPRPFAHTKLFVVDEHYAQIGSANLDPRSLRLNFEIAVEIYDREFGERMTRYIDGLRDGAREVGLADVDGRPLGQRLRDAACWLFSPYL